MISPQTEVIKTCHPSLRQIHFHWFYYNSYKHVHCTTAELVYGTTLWLHGEYVDDSLSIFAHPSNYIDKLKSIMYHLKAIPLDLQQTDRHILVRTYLAIYSCFVWCDAVCKPLTAIYDEPF